LRRDVTELFGDFFSSKGFCETSYRCDEISFGNELFEIAAPSGVSIRFVRDRSQIFIDAKSAGTNYVSIDRLLDALRRTHPGYVWPAAGVPQSLVSDLMSNWTNIEKAILSSPASERSERGKGTQ
jgi:hypothetical protein